MTVFDVAAVHGNKYTLCYVSSIKLPESTIHTRHPSWSAVVKSGVRGPCSGTLTVLEEVSVRVMTALVITEGAWKVCWNGFQLCNQSDLFFGWLFSPRLRFDSDQKIIWANTDTSRLMRLNRRRCGIALFRGGKSFTCPTNRDKILMFSVHLKLVKLLIM